MPGDNVLEQAIIAFGKVSLVLKVNINHESFFPPQKNGLQLDFFLECGTSVFRQLARSDALKSVFTF